MHCSQLFTFDNSSSHFVSLSNMSPINCSIISYYARGARGIVEGRNEAAKLIIEQFIGDILDNDTKCDELLSKVKSCEQCINLMQNYKQGSVKELVDNIYSKAWKLSKKNLNKLVHELDGRANIDSSIKQIIEEIERNKKEYCI